jgi:hypothetical protein
VNESSDVTQNRLPFNESIPTIDAEKLWQRIVIPLRFKDPGIYTIRGHILVEDEYQRKSTIEFSPRRVLAIGRAEDSPIRPADTEQKFAALERQNGKPVFRSLAKGEGQYWPRSNDGIEPISTPVFGPTN